MKLTIIGNGYTAQFLAKDEGGEVLPSKIREYGRSYLSFVNNTNPLLKNNAPKNDSNTSSCNFSSVLPFRLSIC